MPLSARDMIVQAILPHISTATPVLLAEVVRVEKPRRLSGVVKAFWELSEIVS
jgi:hypothetical protein